MPQPHRATAWRAALARSGDAFFVVGRSRRVRYANRAFEVLTGKSPAAWRGMRVSRLLSASPLGRLLAVPPEVWRGELVTVARSTPPAEDGHPWQIQFLPVAGKGGAVAFALGRVTVPDPPPPGTPFIPPADALALQTRSHALYPWGHWEAPSLQARRLLAQARLAATHRAPVWVRGPRGVGKFTLARTIHRHSADRHRAMVRIDGASVQPYLVEVQLFGKGSLAASGEVGAVYFADPPALGGEFRRKLLAWLAAPNAPRLYCGSESTAQELADTRKVEPAFAAELAAVELTVPPLAARPEDVAFYAELWARRTGHPRPDRTTMAALAAYPWPGNLRELTLTLSETSATGPDEPITVARLPRAIQERRLLDRHPPESLPPLPLAQLLATVERRALVLALKEGGHPAAAARRLGITREAFRRRALALNVPLGPADPA